MPDKEPPIEKAERQLYETEELLQNAWSGLKATNRELEESRRMAEQARLEVAQRTCATMRRLEELEEKMAACAKALAENQEAASERRKTAVEKEMERHEV